MAPTAASEGPLQTLRLSFVLYVVGRDGDRLEVLEAVECCPGLKVLGKPPPFLEDNQSL